MKKLLTILLSLMMIFTLAACNKSGGESANEGGEQGGSEAPQTIKIGVATQFEGDQWVPQKDYYEKELGPALNIEFMISERIQDANGLVDFIDQAYAAECQGIINYLTQPEPVQMGARKCEEYGMFFVTQNSKVTDEVATLEHNIGHCGADPVKMGNAYKTLFKDLLADGPHSLLLYSCAAPGQMAASHYYSSLAILEAFQEAYGLTFEKSLDEIVNNQEPGEYATGRDDVKIYVYPGLPNTEGLTDGVQTVLQSGDYDIFAACANFAAFSTGIDAVEKALNKDIKVVGTVGLDEATQGGFSTKDSFGNPVLNAGMINPLNPANAINTAELVNGILGAGAQMKDNGKAVLVGVAPFICKDIDTYNKIANLDRSSGLYILSGEDVKALTVLGNPSVTWKDIDNKLNQIADIEYVLKSRGQ